MHPNSLNSTFVIRYLVEEYYFLLLSKFNYLIHVAEQASLNFTWSEIIKIDFLLPKPIFNKTVHPPACSLSKVRQISSKISKMNLFIYSTASRKKNSKLCEYFTDNNQIALSLPNATVVEFTIHCQMRLQSKLAG